MGSGFKTLTVSFLCKMSKDISSNKEKKATLGIDYASE
jgi:hypothetical protein